jgi:predicted transcriptional regulator
MPEIFRVIKILRDNRWVEVQKISSFKRSMPKRAYYLKTSLAEIAGHIEQKKLEESALSMGTIQRLKEMATATA